MVGLLALACESTQETQQQTDELETTQDEGEQEQLAENEGQEENFQGQGEDFQGQQGNGEFVNNAEDEEFAQQTNGQEFQGEQINNAALDTDQADQLTQEVPDAPLNPAAGQSANEIPPAAEPTAPMPMGGGIVKYAPGNVEVFDQPNGRMVGQLQTGDHPLVYDENGWSRTSDGRYINQNALSVKGVGRPRDPGIWQ
jgi:hypothetical protein